MLGLLSGKPPLGAWEKAWVETRMHWLADQFGIERLLEARVALPHEGCFPGEYQGSADDVRRYFELVCQFMKTGRINAQIEICADAQNMQQPSAEGVDQTEAVIRIPASRLADPQLLVASLAHEAAYDLLRQNRLLLTLTDGPWVADLLAVFLGLGVFSANSTVLETRTNVSDGCARQMQQFGYLPTRMLAYGLALFSWLREEAKPRWAQLLQQDAGSLFRSGLRYLNRTSDSLCRISSLHLQRSAWGVNDLANELHQRSDSRRIAALWDLADRGRDALPATEAVTGCLRSRDPSVRAEAATTLAALGAEVGDSAIARLIECLQDGNTQVRAAAAQALGIAGAGSETVAAELASALGDDSPHVVGAAATALRSFRSAARDSLTAVLQALRVSLVHCHNENAAMLTSTLLCIVPDAELQVQRFFDEYDAELRHVALEILAEQASEGTV